IATRNLCQFLYSHDPRANDIIAEDFFENSSEWQRIRPTSLPDFADGSFVRDISRRLLHLTYDRADGTKMTWTAFRIAWELSKSFEVFVGKVKPFRLCEGIQVDIAVLRRRLQQYVDQFGSVDDVTSVPLSNLWHEDDFWNNPRRVVPGDPNAGVPS
ncbi:MAG: hypothetical protein Q7R41_16065, partial [Phycisphaerales bacterium]|nr:hypothetical protein [Phycisphaerales bacterium]